MLYVTSKNFPLQQTLHLCDSSWKQKFTRKRGDVQIPVKRDAPFPTSASPRLRVMTFFNPSFGVRVNGRFDPVVNTEARLSESRQTPRPVPIRAPSLSEAPHSVRLSAPLHL